MHMQRFCWMLVGLVAAFPAGQVVAQEVYLDFVVTEADFEVLLGELELTEEALIEARALWGRQRFDLREAEKTYRAFVNWQRMTTRLARDFSRAWEQYQRKEQPWPRKEFLRQYSYGQQEVFESFFDDLESLVPYRHGVVDQVRSRLRRRAISRRRWQVQHVAGSSVDLYQLLLDLDHTSPESSFAEYEWSDGVRDIMQEYEPALDGLMTELDRESLRIRFEDEPREKPAKDAEENEKIGWVMWYVERNSRASVIASRIRSLNQATADRIAELCQMRNVSDFWLALHD